MGFPVIPDRFRTRGKIYRRTFPYADQFPIVKAMIGRPAVVIVIPALGNRSMDQVLHCLVKKVEPEQIIFASPFKAQLTFTGLKQFLDKVILPVFFHEIVCQGFVFSAGTEQHVSHIFPGGSFISEMKKYGFRIHEINIRHTHQREREAVPVLGMGSYLPYLDEPELANTGIDRIKESAEKEQKMMERELLMETHLKEAQLKYLQSQINPHFLFNSLNAGAQLAVMEDAEKTCTFLERMADFFRYNVKKGMEDASVGEEVEAVENYIYILNVRFDGDIHYHADIDKDVKQIRMPSMILQPIVENAVNHGIRNIEREGKISLAIRREGKILRMTVKDNGKGMSQEMIDKILSGEPLLHGGRNSNSTGIGMDNVRNRLEMYYDCKGIMKITSGGEDKGTEVLSCKTEMMRRKPRL